MRDRARDGKHGAEPITAPDDRVRTAFLAARQDPDDVTWALQAMTSLALRDVRLDVIEETVLAVAPAVRDSQEGPAELFGPAHVWATRRTEQMSSEGLAVFEDPLLMDLRQSAVLTLSGAAGLSAVLVASFAFALLPGREVSDLTIGLGITPLLLSAAIVLLISVYARAVRRVPFMVTAVLCGLTLALCSLAVAAAILPLDQVGPRVSGWWAILLVPVYAALCWTLRRLWRAPHPAATPEDRPQR